MQKTLEGLIFLDLLEPASGDEKKRALNAFVEHIPAPRGLFPPHSWAGLRMPWVSRKHIADSFLASMGQV